MEYELLSRKLSLTMDRDANASSSGMYFIRSLYFDNFSDSALNEKLEGIDHRNKYRIRIYNLSPRHIKLERKHKEGPYIYKDSLQLSRDECDALMMGRHQVLLQRGERVAKELYAAFSTGYLRPRVIVDYWREAYVFPTEDTRVTFDMDVRTAYRATNLFDKSLPTYPAVDDYDMILEVKFNKYLPGYIRALIQPVQSGERSAISKYCLARKYE
jgi:SPX domain protein involved in polyphosphate accumulation